MNRVNRVNRVDQVNRVKISDGVIEKRGGHVAELCDVLLDVMQNVRPIVNNVCSFTISETLSCSECVRPISRRRCESHFVYRLQIPESCVFVDLPKELANCREMGVVSVFCGECKKNTQHAKVCFIERKQAVFFGIMKS